MVDELGTELRKKGPDQLTAILVTIVKKVKKRTGT